MRPILAAALGLMASSALACPEPGAERHVITIESPHDAKPDELVLRVAVPQGSGSNPHFIGWQTIRAKVLQVLQGNYAGESIVLENGWISPTVRMTSSCSRLGVDSGYVVGRLLVDKTGHQVLITRPRRLARFEPDYFK
jgi:hypothetical protein